MKLRHKFALNGAIPLVLSLIMITIMVFFTRQLQTNAEDDVHLLVYTEQLRGSLITLEQSLDRYPGADRDQSSVDIRLGMIEIDYITSALSPYRFQSEEDNALWTKQMDQTNQLKEKLDAALADNDNAVIRLQIGSIHDIIDVVMELKKNQWTRYVQKETQMRRQLSLIISFAVLGSLAMILVSTGMSQRIYRSISRSIRELQLVIRYVEHGNLAVQANILTGDELGELSQSFNKMIQERRSAEDRVIYLAYKDELTGLSNRRDFHRKLETAIWEAKEKQGIIGVLFLDLDHFKNINDTLGHTSGDMILQMVADQLTMRLGSSVLLARIGGDEFTAMIPDARTQEKVQEIAGMILDELKEPLRLQGIRIPVSVSIGAALYPRDGEDADTLIKHADSALYYGKENGRGEFFFYSPGLSEESVESLILSGELHQALDQGGLVVHYQPQINIDTGGISGFEALVRWNHPELGLIPPGKFIPIAEQSGLIVRIGEYVLRTACQQMKTWLDAGWAKETRISVNLSSRQFLNHDPVQDVRKVLNETGLPASYLEIEITETMTMDVERAISTLEDLKALGVRIAVDDFGTGYSSLHYLKKFPIDRLKIDRSFVMDITDDANDRAIVSTIISMAKNLELSVTAEGVESKEQLQFLVEQRCDEIQGYYYSKPIPAPEAEAWLTKAEE